MHGPETMQLWMNLYGSNEFTSKCFGRKSFFAGMCRRRRSFRYGRDTKNLAMGYRGCFCILSSWKYQVIPLLFSTKYCSNRNLLQVRISDTHWRSSVLNSNGYVAICAPARAARKVWFSCKQSICSLEKVCRIRIAGNEIFFTRTVAP